MLGYGDVFLLVWTGTVLLSGLSGVHALEVGTELGTIVAYGSAIDPLGIRFFLTGIDTKKNFGMSSMSSTETQCYTAVGRSIGYDRKLFPSPPVCLDIHMFKGTSTSSGNANGIVTAMDGNEQPILYEMKYTNYQVALQEPFNLPNGHFPAVVTTDNEHGTTGNGVYVALHPTNGVLNGNDGENVNLATTRDYFRNFFHPRHTSLTNSGDENYSPVVYKYNVETRQEEWQLKFNTTDGKTLITGMATVPGSGRLVVFGSTTGYGFTVGAGARTDGSYWNGFMTWVDLSEGTVDLSDYTSMTHNNVGTAIRSQPDQDDFVLGICADGDKAYVVGYTTGKFEGTVNGGAFILKLDMDGRDPTWKRQFVGTGIEFTHCVVHNDSVIVGGTITADHDPLAPRNGDNAYTDRDTVDIVVAKLNAGSGATQWVRQIDSHRDDDLVSMEVRPGASGDVYLTANAWDLVNSPNIPNHFETQGTIDLYVLSIDQAGNHNWLSIDPNLDPITLLGSSGPPEDTDPPPGGDGSLGGPTSPPTYPSNSSDDSSDEDRHLMVATTIPAVLLVVVLVAIRCFRSKNSGREEKKRSSAAVAKHMTEAEESDKQRADSNGSIRKHDGDFDDVESLASENKLQ